MMALISTSSSSLRLPRGSRREKRACRGSVGRTCCSHASLDVWKRAFSPFFPANIFISVCVCAFCFVHFRLISGRLSRPDHHCLHSCLGSHSSREDTQSVFSL